MNTSVAAILELKGHEVYQTSTTATVREAVQLMNEKHVGALVVTRDGKPVGMFTERDVLVRIVATCRNPDATRIEGVMSSNLTVIEPETSVEEALRIITLRRHRHLPVIDDDGQLVGMVSIGDLTRWIVRDRESYIENLNEYIFGTHSA